MTLWIRHVRAVTFKSTYVVGLKTLYAGMVKAFCLSPRNTIQFKPSNTE